MCFLCGYKTFFFNSTIVDLQCCINFCCTVKWFSYTYTYTFFLNILSYYGLSQDIEYNPLWHTIGTCLSILHKKAASVNASLPLHPSSNPLPSWQPKVCSLCLDVKLLIKWSIWSTGWSPRALMFSPRHPKTLKKWIGKLM